MCPNIQYSEVLVLINDGTLDIYVSFSPCPYFRTRPFCLQLKKIYMYISLYQVPTSIWDQCTSTMLENYDNLSCQIWSPQGPLLGRLWSVTTNRMDGNILLISSLPLFLSGGGWSRLVLEQAWYTSLFICLLNCRSSYRQSRIISLFNLFRWSHAFQQFLQTRSICGRWTS